MFAQISISHNHERLLLEQSHFIENYEIRQRLRNVILSKQFNSIDISARVYTQETSTNRVRVSVVRVDNFFYIVFANEMFLLNQNENQNISSQVHTKNSYDLLLSDRFKMNGRGNYIIKKRISDGEFEHIKIYLQSNSESYLLIKPINNHEVGLDVFLFDVPIYRNVRLPISFMSVATIPLARIMSATSHLIDWNLIFIPLQEHRDRWNTLLRIARQVELHIPELVFAGDGAQNSSGNFVHIQTQEPQKNNFGLGNAGFVKWIMDGIFAPLNSGLLTSISNLKTVTPRNTTNKSNSDQNISRENIFFHLDWNRNLAYFVNRAMFPRHRININDSDVNDTPFLAYIPDVGYPISSLEVLLYLESIRNVGSIFLGSINSLSPTSPPIRTYMESIVIVPYFDTSGNLQAKIFRNNQIIDILDLQILHPGSFIHLQKINTSTSSFALPYL